jgi:hypothetical protein
MGRRLAAAAPHHALHAGLGHLDEPALHERRVCIVTNLIERHRQTTLACDPRPARMGVREVTAEAAQYAAIRQVPLDRDWRRLLATLPRG